MDLEMFLEEADVLDLPRLIFMKRQIESKIRELNRKRKELEEKYMQWNEG